jgi:hypothetical protein
MQRLPILSALIIFAVFISCKKESEPVPEEGNASLAIEFDNVVGEEDLELVGTSYTNAAGENYSISNFTYFVSNFQFTKTDGSTHTVPQDSSYFLINEGTGSTEPVLPVPVGDYANVTFLVGVDSLRSTMDLSKRTGALAPLPGTYWNENQGYIFFTLEGNSPQAENSRFRFQVGGYGGKTAPTFNNIKTVSLDLTAAGVAKAHAGDTSVVHLLVDIAKVFTGSHQISLAENSQIGFEPASAMVAENYQQMFRHDHTHNH